MLWTPVCSRFHYFITWQCLGYMKSEASILYTLPKNQMSTDAVGALALPKGPSGFLFGIFLEYTSNIYI